MFIGGRLLSWRYHPRVSLPLSVAIVCKNNEATIARTLASVKGLASEIVAVDSGSTDQTIPMLQYVGANVIRSAWLGHVKTKQLALQACSLEWVLCLDSDESVDAQLAEAITAVVSKPLSGVHGYRVNRKVWWAGGYLNHAWQPEWRLRLVRGGRAAWGGIDPHDELRMRDPADKPQDLKGTLRHDAIDSFSEFLEKQVRYGRLTAQGLHAAGQRGRAWRLVSSPLGAFLKQMVLKQAFMDGWRGWLAATGTAVAAAAKHAALIELGKVKAKD